MYIDRFDAILKISYSDMAIVCIVALIIGLIMTLRDQDNRYRGYMHNIGVAVIMLAICAMPVFAVVRVAALLAQQAVQNQNFADAGQPMRE